ncbi:asparagine synthetase B family protein [Caballeronia sp. LZ032]|uniref:asparagine synthetase B family protein n=1 Tax=Caballeronia sp. LZ032 TaxID=3038565 RepID=UPI002861420E|nr:asparagine synthetase B family protein [Caballeronia sp. LZ032]MDR5877152.1 asparagine synthetase B family protein [Caballeronia sp. LZ032]
MTFSFIAVPHSGRKPSPSLANLQSEGECFEIAGWQLWLKTWRAESFAALSHVERHQTHVLIGSVTNIDELRVLAATITAEALTANDAAVLHTLHQVYGDAVFAMVEGPYTFLTFGSRGTLAVKTDAHGLQPVHAVSGRSAFWLTSELKNVARCRRDELDFLPEDDVLAHDNRADTFLPLRNGARLRPGSAYSFGSDGREHPVMHSVSYLGHRLAAPQRLRREHARELTCSLLSDSIRSLSRCSGPLSIPLSGGLDSSMVTAIAARHRDDVRTLAIGTGTSNEFPFARTVSRHVRTTHSEQTFTDQEILRGAHEAIYYNEIFDGLSAEIQASLLCLYRTLEGIGGRVITGYGSDLLFGGVLKPGSAPADVNPELWRQIYRTRWTGEFSPFGANRYGLDVHHPFWTPRLVAFALNLAPDMKVATDEVKVMLRECAAEHALLPDEIVWRKKIGIHEGSSVNQIYASHIGVETGDYVGKTRYTYRRYRALLSGEDAL